MTLLRKLYRTRLLTIAGVFGLLEGVLTTGTNLMALLRVAAKLHPQRTAVIDEQERLSYPELWRQAGEASGGAQDRRNVTRTPSGRFSNWPMIHTGRWGPGRWNTRGPPYRLAGVPPSVADLVARQASSGLNTRRDCRSLTWSASRTNSRASPTGWAAMAPRTCSARPSMVQSGGSGAAKRSVRGLPAVTGELPVS